MATQDSQSDARSETTSQLSDYPEGPITCCLHGISKEVRVLKTRSWTVSLIISVVTVPLTLLFFLVAFGTIGWVRVEKIDQHPHRVDMVGLWRECLGEECSYITSDVTGAGFKAAQVFAVLCLVLIAMSLIVTYRYAFATLSDVKDSGKAAVAMRFLSFVFLLLLIPVFAATWHKGHARYDKNIYDGDLHYSFKLVATAFVMEAIGAFFMYCEVLVIQPRRRKPLIKERSVHFYDGITNEGFTELNDSGIFPGDMNLGPSQIRQERLEDQVQGRINAKAAYENFASGRSELQIGGAGVAGVMGPLASSGLMGKSAEDIARRFIGITLAEPQYIPKGNHYTTPNTEPTVTSAAPRRTYTDLDITRDSTHMQQSVSMQNVFNENLSVTRAYSEDNAMITSVSMYNLTDDPAEKPYENGPIERKPGERDDFSMQSWHPEGSRVQGGYNRADGKPKADKDRHRQYQEHRSNTMAESRDAPPSYASQVPHKKELRDRSSNREGSRMKKHPVSADLSRDTGDMVSGEYINRDHISDIHDQGQYATPAKQTQYKKQPGMIHETTAPAERRKGRRSKTTNKDQTQHDHNHLPPQKPNMSHAQSTGNLSLASAATSIVGGCSETEI